MSVQLFHVGVKALVRDGAGKILVLKVNQEKLKNITEAYWDIPGGRIEEGQTVQQTLEREVLEEIGTPMAGDADFYSAVVSNIRIPTDNGEVGLVLMVYRVTLPDNAVIKLSPEHTAYEWVDPAEAAERLRHKYPEEFTRLLMH